MSHRTCIQIVVNFFFNCLDLAYPHWNIKGRCILSYILMLSKTCNFHSDIEPRIYDPSHTILYNVLLNGIVLLIPSDLQKRHKPMIFVVLIVYSQFYRLVEYARVSAYIGIINSIPATPHPPPRTMQMCILGRTCWGGREVKWQSHLSPGANNHAALTARECDVWNSVFNSILPSDYVDHRNSCLTYLYFNQNIYLSHGYDSDSLCNLTLGLL